MENARVLTGDPRRPVAGAVAIAGRRIVAVGERAAIVRHTGSRVLHVDCGGATVLPGLVDPHLHLFGLAARTAHLDCAAFTEVAALLDAVAVRAAALTPGTWLRGEGLDEARLGRLPTAVELDRAAPHVPVRLRHRSRHASVLSSSGLAQLPPDLAGLERVRGVPTGLVAGHEEPISAAVGPLPPGEIDAGLERASAELVRLGITTVADATPRRWAALAPLRRTIAAGTFAPRVFAMRPWDARAWRAREHLHPGPVKILVEETPAGLAPDPDELARRIRVAASRGAQVAVHCLGAATLAAVVEAFAALAPAARRGRRHRLEHLAECPPPYVARIAALGLMVVTNPAFVYWRGDVYRRETEGVAAAWLYRARSLVRAGVAVAGASDAPVVTPSPWAGIAAARDRRTRDGDVLGPGERLGAAAALALFTTQAARALRADGLGMLVPGGRADLVVVEPDPLRASPAAVRETRVRLTMIDGRIVWRA